MIKSRHTVKAGMTPDGGLEFGRMVQNKGYGSDRLFSHVSGSEKASRPSNSGSGSREVAAFGSIGALAGGRGVGITGGGSYPRSRGSLLFSGQHATLNRLVEDVDYKTKYDWFLDIYHHDQEAGTTVDFMSDMPVSKLKVLVQAENRAKDMIEAKIDETFKALNITEMLVGALRSHFVTGAYVSMLVIDPERRIVRNTMPVSYRNCTMLPNPFFGRFPLIRVELDDKTKRYFSLTESELVRQTRSQLPEEFSKFLNQGHGLLRPASSLYFPRPLLNENDSGVSIFERMLSLYFMESTLTAATRAMINRRIAPIRHITVDTSETTYAPEELDELIELMMEADRDPLGAVFATFDKVQINEVGSPGDFYKIFDVWPDMAPRKMVAMGAPEEILSGNVTYNNLEHAITWTLERAKDTRMRLETAILDKIVQVVLKINEFKKGQYGAKSTITGRPSKVEAFMQNFTPFGDNSFRGIGMDIGGGVDDFDPADYVDFTYEWEKKLGPRASEEMLEGLQMMADRGFPIAPRLFAAAAGLTWDQIEGEFDRQIEDTKRIEAVKRELDKITGAADGNEDAPGFNFASLNKAQVSDVRQLMSGHYSANGIWTPQRNQGEVRRVPLLARQFTEEQSEVRAYDSSGRRIWKPNQHAEKRRENSMIVDTLHKMDNESKGVGHRQSSLLKSQVDIKNLK